MQFVLAQMQLLLTDISFLVFFYFYLLKINTLNNNNTNITETLFLIKGTQLFVKEMQFFKKQ